MTRKFKHTFKPPKDSPVKGNEVKLTVRQIEEAGLREILQTQGPAYGPWEILDSLLEPGRPFVFRGPLGHSREVKVALSGLFGRFVARAYLVRYFKFSIFSPVNTGKIWLDGRYKIKIKKRKGYDGDLPDWVVAKHDPKNGFSSLSIVEAKGTQALSGPAQPLKRAWDQAKGVDILRRGRRVAVKRMAIATSWGMSSNGINQSWIAVQDPIDQGDQLEPEEKDALYIGLFRLHAASMLVKLGHVELASSLIKLTKAKTISDLEVVAGQATSLLEAVEDDQDFRNLIGGVVRHSGTVSINANLAADTDSLMRILDKRTVVVGIHRNVIQALINGDSKEIGEAITLSYIDGPARKREDHAGGYICSLRDED